MEVPAYRYVTSLPAPADLQCHFTASFKISSIHSNDIGTTFKPVTHLSQHESTPLKNIWCWKFSVLLEKQIYYCGVWRPQSLDSLDSVLGAVRTKTCADRLQRKSNTLMSEKSQISASYCRWPRISHSRILQPPSVLGYSGEGTEIINNYSR